MSALHCRIHQGKDLIPNLLHGVQRAYGPHVLETTQVPINVPNIYFYSNFITVN